ncbi:MAG TPA: glycoside hydrolase family 15 protein [Candidatus Saccharimonas sp.]|mgnify:CR=1 FL=1|nr:glycoside hydrolase family 15 protein [Candidatus Saccharimonas sp.]
MARPIVLSNGELHVGINTYGLVHDFYYPYVGLENHAAGQSLRHHIGVWVDGKISWLDDKSWEFDFSYPHEALVGHTVAKNHDIGIMLEFDDTVDAEFSAFMRNLHVINLSAGAHDVRIFMHQAFVIGDGRSNTDTAQYLPDANAILHYRGRRAFIISGQDDNGEWFDQYTVGLFDIEGREGTYKDADDGELSSCPVEHGRVDSTLRFKVQLDPHSSARFHYWVTCGTSAREALYIHKQLTSQGVHKRLDVTVKWWHEWLKPAKVVADKIDASHRDVFLKSVMIMKSHIDKRGAVIASTDTSMLNYWRDAYAYCWPRDGAYVMWPLIRMGYKDEPYRFFEFCRRALSAGGYLMHKYRADGALGSSWHPYIHAHDEVAPPIQQDETALVLFVFSQFYHMQRDDVMLKEFYEPMVVPMANFLASYINTHTGLPRPSYDLWEEVFMTTTYTTAVTHAALLAAADLAEVRKDNDNAVKWRAAADDIHQAAHKLLYNTDKKCFYKGVTVSEDGTVKYDDTIDMSSIFGSFMFGLFGVDTEETKNAVATAEARFAVSDEVPAIGRYENDGYRRVHEDTLGNWWFVTSLWLAQYHLETGNHDRADKVLKWVRDRAWDTGVLTEQIDPVTREEVSVAPLTWSQAEYVSTLLDTVTEN